ncbi:MAG TPA: hypothetical protein VMW93_04890 [bacterium]|nr:hypothetical protein [bacterium]
MNIKRAAGIAFFLVIVLNLGLVWCSRYVPTQDGPSHLANAVTLKNLVLPGEAGVEYSYRVNWRLFPNWAYYAVVAPLAAVAPPHTAERIFLSGYVLGFAFAVYRLTKAAGADTAAPALAAFPFALALPFHLGFFNYCLGVVIMLAALAYFWRRRDRVGWKEGLAVSAFAVATYFCHIVPAVLLLAYVYLLLLCTSFSRRHAGAPASPRRALFFWATLPAWVLPAHYATTAEAGRLSWIPPAELFYRLVRGWPLEIFHKDQRLVGIFAVAVAAAAIIGVVAMVLSRRRRRPRARDAFGVAALASLALYFLFPDSGFGGGAISVRLSVFAFLFIFVWAGDDFGRWGKRVALAAAAALALSSWVGNLLCYRILSRGVAEVVTARPAVAAGSSFVFLDYGGPQHRVAVFRHAGAYFALDGDVLDLGNYEGRSRDFPVDYRGPSSRPPRTEIAAPDTYDANKYAAVVDYVITWEMPEPGPAAEFGKSYDVVFERPRLKVFKARRAAGKPPG